MRRRAFKVAVVVVVLLVVLGAALLLALPSIVRWAAVAGIRSAAGGRPTTIRSVQINLFAGRLVLAGLRIDDRAGGPPLAELDRFEARFRILPLVYGRLHLDALTIAAPRVRVLRDASGRLNVQDILDSYSGGKPSKEPANVVLGRLDLDGGAVTFEDQAVTPPRTWEAAGITLAVRDIATRSAAARGTVTARMTIAGAPLELTATDIRVKPARAKATVVLTSLDLAPFWTYVTGNPPVVPQGGRYSTRLELDYAAESGVRAGGDVVLEGLGLLRRGQTQPFVFTPVLKMTSRDIVYKDGALTAARLELMGDPSIVDASVSPAQRFDLSGLHVVVENASYPAGAPARIMVTSGLPAGGAVDVRGTADLYPVAANLDVTVTNVDLKLARAYVPSTVPIGADGRLGTALKIAYAADGTVRASGDVSVAKLALTQRGQAEASVTDPLLKATITDAEVRGTAFSLKRIRVDGAPTLVDATVTPPRRVALRRLSLETGDVGWPAAAPAPVRLRVDLPTAGTVEATGTVAAASRSADLVVRLRDAALAPYAAWLPVDAPLDGRAEATLTVKAAFADALTLGVKGSAGARSVVLGSGGNAPVALERATVTGLDVRWPSRVVIERLTLTKPHVLLERDKSGAFPLRAMLAPRATSASPAPVPAPTPTPVAATSASARPAMAIEIGEIVVDDGDARFVDQSVTPFFSEEISHLALTVRGLRNAADARADVAVQAVIGPRGALDLKGQVAPYGEPFYLDLAGELRDVSLTEANPFMRAYSGWIARTGSATTKIHYRVVGDELEASNDVHVQKIRVERAPGDDASVAKRVGLPLGLIVAMITDSRGDIQFNVPVTGKLNAPGFSFGDAVWSAIKNVLVNVAAAPFRAIGKLFGGGKGEAEEEFRVDPVPFEAGSADVTPDAQRQLQRIADFLRASPYVTLAIQPVVTGSDVQSLKTQAVLARVQRVQRERTMPDLAAAARTVFEEAVPGTPPPKTTDEVVAALSNREPMPEEAVQRLAERRLEATRTTLVQAAGIEPARLQQRPVTASDAETKPGRVQFELVP